MIGIATLSLIYGTFDPGQPVPQSFPFHTALAYAAGLFLLAAGSALLRGGTATAGAAALAAYYSVVVVVILNGRIVLAHPAVFGVYSGAAEQAALAAGAAIFYATQTGSHGLLRVAQRAFGVCALLFGGAQFVYMNLTAPLVPAWLPPTQRFWGIATVLCSSRPASPS